MQNPLALQQKYVHKYVRQVGSLSDPQWSSNLAEVAKNPESTDDILVPFCIFSKLKDDKNQCQLYILKIFNYALLLGDRHRVRVNLSFTHWRVE